MERLEASIVKKVGELQAQIAQSTKRDAAQDKDLKQEVYTVMKITRETLDSAAEAIDASLDGFMSGDDEELISIRRMKTNQAKINEGLDNINARIIKALARFAAKKERISRQQVMLL